MLRGYVSEYLSRGDGLLAIKESLILCGFEGFFVEYEPVLLAGKNEYRTWKFSRGAKIC